MVEIGEIVGEEEQGKKKKKKKKRRKERKKEKGGGRTITNLLKTLPPSYKLGVERNGREGERTGKEL